MPTPEEVRKAYREAWGASGLSAENRAQMRTYKALNRDPTVRQLRSELKRMRSLGFTERDPNVQATEQRLRAAERVHLRRQFRASLTDRRLMTPEELELASEMDAARADAIAAQRNVVPVTASWRARYHERRYPRRVMAWLSTAPTRAELRREGPDR